MLYFPIITLVKAMFGSLAGGDEYLWQIKLGSTYLSHGDPLLLETLK